VRDRLRHRPQVEQHRHQVHAGDAVHERVVVLGDQREAPALEALHEPGLPQRLGAVERLGVDAGGERPQLVLGARLGERGVADVELEVEARVVHPQRPAALQGRERELLAVARDEVQPRADVVDERLEGRRRAFEDEHGPDVHVRGGALLREERRVHRREPVTVVLRHRLPFSWTPGSERTARRARQASTVSSPAAAVAASTALSTVS
jgi:hypothetical protein